MQVKPARCVVFEDTQAAQATGMVTVAVPTFVTQTLDFSLADATIDSLEMVTLDWLVELSTNLR